MESKDFSCFSRKPCEVQWIAADTSEANKVECCEFEARWRICNNKKLNKDPAMIPEAHISVFQTEDTISDQMLNFSLSGLTCEEKFNVAKVDELDNTTNTHCLFTEKYNGDDALLPIPSQNWSYFESFINENKEEFLDLCPINDFSTNLISEDDSHSFLFDAESTLNSDVCSLKIRYESFQDNIKDKNNAHQDDAQLQFFPSACCNGIKKEGKTPIKNSDCVQDEKREHDIPEHASCELESKKCLMSGVLMDDCKDAESSLDSVCLSSGLLEDQGDWKFLKDNADRYSSQSNYTLRAKRQIRYSDDYLYDVDSLETMKSLGKTDHATDTPKEDDDDWCPRKRKKTGKKEPPVIIKYIIVNRFKGHKNMHVKISRLDCTESQVLLTDEVEKKYKKLSPLKEFWSPVPNCNVHHNQERNDRKLKICSDAGMSYMFFASKNKKQKTLANGTAPFKVGHTLNHRKDNVIETVDSNSKVPKKIQQYDKSVYEFTDEIELKRITIRTVTKAGRLRDIHEKDLFQKSRKQSIPSKKMRADAQYSKDTSSRDYLKNTHGNPRVLSADVHEIQGEWNSAAGSSGDINPTGLYSRDGDGIETSRELLSPVPASSPGHPVTSVYNVRSAPKILGGYFRTLLDGDDSSVDESFKMSSQDSSTGKEFNEDGTENSFSSPQQRQTCNSSTRCNNGESNVLPLEFEPNIQETCNSNTIHGVPLHRIIDKELFSSCAVDTGNEKVNENQLDMNNIANQYGLKIYSFQNELNTNLSQKLSEGTKHLFTSKDTLCILDISNFTPGKVKPTFCSDFSKECTREIPSTAGNSDVNSMEQSSQHQFPMKASLLNECSEQFQIHSELYSTNIQTCCLKSEPTSVSSSPYAESSNQLPTSDHASSNNYKYSKVNKAFNSFRKGHAKSNTKQRDRTTIQKYENCKTENKAIKIENVEKTSISPENHGIVKDEEYSSDTLYANRKKQSNKACKPTKGFTNKDLEMCTKMVKKGLMSSKNMLSMKEENLNGKDKCWIAPAESNEYVPSNITRGIRLVNSDQREFEEPGNILSNIVSGMAAVKQFMMASVEPILNQREVVLPALNQYLEVQNSSKRKPKPIQLMHVGVKDMKNQPLHVSECTLDNLGFDN